MQLAFYFMGIAFYMFQLVFLIFLLFHYHFFNDIKVIKDVSFLDFFFFHSGSANTVRDREHENCKTNNSKNENCSIERGYLMEEEAQIDMECI